MKDIKEQYKQETKGRVYSEELESTSYTDEYVRWIEQKLASNTEIIGSVSEIDKELIEWINDTEKRVDMFNKNGYKDFAKVSDNFIEAYKSVRDMINEKCSR